MERLKADVDRLARAMFGEPDEQGVLRGGVLSDIRSLDRSVQILTRSNDHVTDQIAEAVVAMREQQGMVRKVMDKLAEHDGRIDDNAGSLRELLGKVDDNTAITARSVVLSEQLLASTASIAGTVATIQDMQAAGRLGAKVLRGAKAVVLWLEPVAKAAAVVAAGLAAAWVAIKGGPPKG